MQCPDFAEALHEFTILLNPVGFAEESSEVCENVCSHKIHNLLEDALDLLLLIWLALITWDSL
jgi:hypothetical protein